MYRIDPTRTLVQVFVYRAGALAAKGHNHVIAAREIDGYLIPDDGQGGARGDIYMPALGLSVDEQVLRQAAGEDFASVPDADDIDGTRRNMLGEKALNAGSHPFVQLELTAPRLTAGKHTVQVQLVAGGSATTLDLPVDIELTSELVRARGEVRLAQTALGIEPFSILGGAIRVADEVTIDFEVVATTGASNSAEVWRDCDACPELVAIPPGTFWMGSDPAETEREGVPEHQAAPERPRHLVSIGRSFAMGRSEVTRSEYAAFADATGRSAAPCLVYANKRWYAEAGASWREPPFAQGTNHPVVCVNWADADAYVGWLSEQTGYRYRLPSEAEWEYAARAGTTTARYWGDGVAEACRYANVADAQAPRPQFECEDPHPYTAPADYGIANGFGLYGMLGNVGEWVRDCGYPDYAVAPRDGRPAPDVDCDTHVGRGGSWWNDAYYIRAARRFHMAGGYFIVGFRVARDIDPTAEVTTR